MQNAEAQTELRGPLETTYNQWRAAMIKGDVSSWQASTAKYRQMEIHNRLVSERLQYPAAVFQIPAPPPELKGLKFLEARQKGATAKMSYFGKIDFGVDGKPSDNLLVLSFIQEGSAWKYDTADFVNLAVLPAVRTELAAGNLHYLEEAPEARPSGEVPPIPMSAPAAKYVAKVYVFCPGREVQVQINKFSRHKFANAKEAETVIGGVVDGSNEIQFTTRKLEGGTGKEAMTIRVYLVTDAQSTDPSKSFIKVFEYQIQPEGVPKESDTRVFNIDPATAAKVKIK